MSGNGNQDRDYWTPDWEEDSPPTNMRSEDVWFCATVENGRKLPMAPWVEENPQGEPSGWNHAVGHNWDGLRTDYETAKEWAERYLAGSWRRRWTTPVTRPSRESTS
jgi:hypothetical protein